MKYDAVVVASGKAERANLGYNKVFYLMADGNSVLWHACHLFLDDEDCMKVIVVTNEENFAKVFENEKVVLVKGGLERMDSVRNGLEYVDSEYVLIHDGARPYLDVLNLNEIKKELENNDALCLGHLATDTIKYIEDDKIVKTLDRNNIFMAETPQAFKSSLIKKCYEEVGDNLYTDDASLVEASGHEVKVIINHHDNHKLTKPEDFVKL